MRAGPIADGQNGLRVRLKLSILPSLHADLLLKLSPLPKGQILTSLLQLAESEASPSVNPMVELMVGVTHGISSNSDLQAMELTLNRNLRQDKFPKLMDALRNTPPKERADALIGFACIAMRRGNDAYPTVRTSVESNTQSNTVGITNSVKPSVVTAMPELEAAVAMTVEQNPAKRAKYAIASSRANRLQQ